MSLAADAVVLASAVAFGFMVGRMFERIFPDFQA